MNAKELRQAAILLHDWYCKPDDQITYGNNHPWFYMDEDATNADQTKAARLVKDHILATVQEDGELSVDEAWLRDEWGFTDEQGDMVLVVPKWEAIYWVPELSRIEFGMTWARITTRSQFRNLMKGLGIEPQKISEKR